MTSPNAPILAKILEAINGITVRLDTIEHNTAVRFDRLETRMTGLETRMTGLERRVDNLANTVDTLIKYNRNEARTQEVILTNRVKESLEEDEYTYPTHTIRSFPFGNFFIPSSNNAFTDIDGCLLIKSNSHGNNLSGALKNSVKDAVYIIEVKHGFTKALIDYKLKQFCTILSVFNDIRNEKLVPSNPPRTQFDTMVTNFTLANFLENIQFVFASDYIDPDLAEFISAINAGTINEEMYNTYLMRQLYSHLLINDILNDKDVNGQIKSIFRDGLAPIRDIYDLFTIKDLSTVKNKAKLAYERKKNSIAPYKERILNLLPPFNTVKGCYETLKGRLSMFYDGVYMKKTLMRNASLFNGNENSKNN